MPKHYGKAGKMSGYNDGTKTHEQTPPMKGGSYPSPDVRYAAKQEDPKKPKKM